MGSAGFCYIIIFLMLSNSSRFFPRYVGPFVLQFVSREALTVSLVLRVPRLQGKLMVELKSFRELVTLCGVEPLQSWPSASTVMGFISWRASPGDAFSSRMWAADSPVPHDPRLGYSAPVCSPPVHYKRLCKYLVDETFKDKAHTKIVFIYLQNQPEGQMRNAKCDWVVMMYLTLW